MNIALYLRVSTQEQSVEAQRIELRAYCAQRGWTIIREVEDVISGSKSQRLGLDSLMAEVQARKYDAVLVVKLDRMARSIRHLAQLIDQFEESGVALVCTSQGIDTTNNSACGKLQLAVLSAIAAFERDLIRERTRAGLVAARASGKTVGRKSPKMPASEEARAHAVNLHRQAYGDSEYDKLALALGGVSRATAWRLARKYPAGLVETVEV